MYPFIIDYIVKKKRKKYIAFFYLYCFPWLLKVLEMVYLFTLIEHNDSIDKCQLDCLVFWAATQKTRMGGETEHCGT